MRLLAALAVFLSNYSAQAAKTRQGMPLMVGRMLEEDHLEPIEQLRPSQSSTAMSINPIMWNITIFHPQANELRNSQPSAQNPMVCDFILLTAIKLSESHQLFHSFRLEYARRQATQPDPRHRHVVCFLNFNPVDESELRKNELKVVKYRAAFHVLGMIAKRRITSPSYNSQKPPVLLVDDNTFISNTERTVFDVFRRVDAGCTSLPAVEQFCNEVECQPPVKRVSPRPWVRRSASERYHPDFFFIANLEAECYTGWAVSAGALVFKSHPLAQLLLEATILTAVSEVEHRYHGHDQGSLNFALAELFGVNHDKMKALCYPFENGLWETSLKSDQLMFDVTLDRSALENHIVFAPLHKKYHKQLEELARFSRIHDRAVLVNPRWLAPAACPGHLLHRQRASLAWHSGDFIARFNGCDKLKGLRSEVFVDQVLEGPQLVPFPEKEKLNITRSVIRNSRFKPLEDPEEIPV
eukprot:Protomagalhaensia_sp_Gyna_25__1463@NODE_1743_length_1572_cov_15_912590_g1431_i0_p1_GENE_NODE_1743_length_1572_cov_15_912590_g1431_i0NODE_1743_length_1572_cov_15_912590_g1431_i0_p1_ORF_typecomplete_len468_score72_46DUF273/PF03314_14/0_032ssDNA_DBD/PF18333_1/0_12ssDNA_DBD/PF18333_1/9_8e03_NODE_1743_length_1572_cov_15_912590_g1431_i0891492